MQVLWPSYPVSSLRTGARRNSIATVALSGCSALVLPSFFCLPARADDAGEQQVCGCTGREAGLG